MYLIQSLDLDQVASGLRCEYKRNRAALGAPRGSLETTGAKRGDGEAKKSSTLS